MAAKSILDLLVNRNVVTLESAKKFREEARSSGKNLEEVLIDHEVPAKQILEAKSEVLGIPIRDLAGYKVTYEILKYIPEESARHYNFIPIDIKNGVLEVGMVYPEDIEAREALQFISSNTSMPFKIFLISRYDLEELLKGYGGLPSEVKKALGDLGSTAKKDDLKLPKVKEESKGAVLKEEAPITKTVGVILRHAIEGKASDVHIEPLKDRVRVRFRVDGILYTSIFLPKNVHEAVISRIKIMATLKIDEKRMPQDGRFRASIGGKDLDFRVSTFSTYYGEKAVLRILDPEVGLKKLPELGLEGKNLQIVEEGLKKHHGLILITGPTGSGKTTTLYAMLQILNDEKRNIISLEDPVEYYIAGINQSQVKPEIGYTFANGLRHVLRQDPDVIMVGEIRDAETAQLAIHAALTGHVVLSTLHTNDAIGAIPRLVDMGVEPFLIPSTLLMSLAQRLPSSLCDDSKKEIPLTGKVKEYIDKEVETLDEQTKKQFAGTKKIYEALASPVCPRGTRGRLGVFEVLKMTPELEEIVLKDLSENVLAKEAKRQGMMTMRQDGIIKVLQGRIGLEALKEVVI
ncbi:GspE/PulE family protein [Patescibacteria group bacterium]